MRWEKFCCVSVIFRMPCCFQSIFWQRMLCRIIKYSLIDSFHYNTKYQNFISAKLPAITLFTFCFIILSQNFRQDYCRFNMDLIEYLEDIDNMTHCQISCQNVPKCNFFTFLKDEQVCKLQGALFNFRICDIVHGTATPSYQSCIDDNTIPWLNYSGNWVDS